MARRPNGADPLVAVRRMLRALRATRATENGSRATLLRIVEIALFRLPERQREIIRRYDLEGEDADDVQRALAVSARQFFRDRRAALTALLAYLPTEESAPPSVNGSSGSPTAGNVRDVALSRRAFARSLAQTGNPCCLGVMREVAQSVTETTARADVLLELADIAADYEQGQVARSAIADASALLHVGFATAPDISDYLAGRLARAHGRLAGTRTDAATYFSQAIELLRRALYSACDPSDARIALAETLGDVALLDFELGAFTEARAASQRSAQLIEDFGLLTRPRALEILAMDAALDACFSGRTTAAIETVCRLLRRAVEAGWSATACRLGADLVGLKGIGGAYDDAVGWYRRITSGSFDGARPADRSNLAMEAAHAFTVTGKAREALTILNYVPPGGGCPRDEVPGWHASTGAALERLGDNRLALHHARLSLEAYTSRGVSRGMGDGHRLIAIAQAKLGNARAAREHIKEAHRLTERYGTPYGLLRTLAAEAAILQSEPLKKEAIEFRRLLFSG